MRDRETIDSELRLLAAVRRVCREPAGAVPSMGPVDELLDESSELTGSWVPYPVWSTNVTSAALV
jgi:hypothetical protein